MPMYIVLYCLLEPAVRLQLLTLNILPFYSRQSTLTHMHTHEQVYKTVNSSFSQTVLLPPFLTDFFFIFTPELFGSIRHRVLQSVLTIEEKVYLAMIDDVYSDQIL